MWFYFALLGFSLQLLVRGESHGFRIIAGERVTTREFPYQADLERGERHWCGGSIIHKFFILTAAHCIKTVEKHKPVPEILLRVRVGNDQVLTGGRIYGVAEAIPHEKYDDTAVMDEYDIGLLRLNSPLEFSDNVRIIALAVKEPRSGELGWVTGYGKQEMMRRSHGEERFLMAVELPVVSLSVCRRRLSNVADDMICAGHPKGNRDACTGDSGGPYVVRERQVGVVAWGIGCGREGLPGVYTNVAFYKDWIEKKIASFSEETRRQSSRRHSLRGRSF